MACEFGSLTELDAAERELTISRNYLDKTTLSYSSVMGLRDDINLVGDNYQWLGSLFYIGYLVSRQCLLSAGLRTGTC